MFGRRDKESDDLRAFIRDLMARFDRGMERQAVESRQYFEALNAKIDEIQAEGRAGREALFRILDRLDGNGETSAAG
jgi:hypothetical protein